MDIVVALVGHLAWPVTILLLLFVLRREARGVVDAVRTRIASKESDVSIGKSGIEIKTNIQAINARLETVETGQGQFGQLLLQQLEAGSSAPAEISIPAELRRMADEYLEIQAPNWNDRVRLKDEAANRLGTYVVQRRVPREALANEHNEGLVIALASAVLAAPEKDDSRRLLTAAKSVHRLHVRYRILVALSRLVERRLLDPTEIEEWRGLLDRFEHGADASLLRMIEWTRSLLRTEEHEVVQSETGPL